MKKNYVLEQSSTNYDSPAKSSSLPIFINKCFKSKITPFTYLHIIYGCFCFAVADFSNCDRDCMDSKD